MGDPVLDAFLRALSVCYACAFLSITRQFPALLGEGGLDPASARAPALGAVSLASWITAPNLLSLRAWFGASLDTAGVAIGVLGFLLSLRAANASVAARSAVTQAVLWLLYASLYASGGTFLSFQWDILLLEAGAAAVLACVTGPRSGRWLLKLLVVKLMVMSGVVKLQSGCDAWSSLTATEVHFASQCIPTPLASFLHSGVPPTLHALGVAGMLWIELPGALLLLVGAWAPLLATAGVVLQVLLQLAIIVSGSYTFFNWFTIALALACLPDSPAPAAGTAGSSSTSGSSPLSLLERALRHRYYRALQALALLAYISGTAQVMFRATIRPEQLNGVAVPLWARLQVELSPLLSQRSQLNAALDSSLPAICAYVAVAFALSAVLHVGAQLVAVVDIVVEKDSAGASSSSSSAVGRVWRGGVGLGSVLLTATAYAATGYVGAASMTPLLSLRQPLLQRPWAGQLVSAYHTLAPAHLTAGYGLFRSMTGKGATGVTDAWGLPVATTARPEVVIEALFAADGDASDDTAAAGGGWRELEFPYKPGNPYRTPTVAAPHQPRLDWQMWFAALGSYGQNGWLVHFLDLLLEGSPSALSLLDLDAWPLEAVEGRTLAFADAAAAQHPVITWLQDNVASRLGLVAPSFASSSTAAAPQDVQLYRAPLAVRAKLYHYDFVRARNSWSARVPQLGSAGEAAAVHTVWHPALAPLLDDGSRRNITAATVPWWTRKAVGEYFPTVKRGDESMAAFLEQFGWADSRQRVAFGSSGSGSSSGSGGESAVTAAAGLGQLTTPHATVKRKAVKGNPPVLQLPSQWLDCAAHVRAAAEHAAGNGYPHMRPQPATAARPAQGAVAALLASVRASLDGFMHWLYLASRGLQNVLLMKLDGKSNPSGVAAVKQAGAAIRAAGAWLGALLRSGADIARVVSEYAARGTSPTAQAYGSRFANATVSHVLPVVAEAVCHGVNAARGLKLAPVSGWRWERGDAVLVAVPDAASPHATLWWWAPLGMLLLVFGRGAELLLAATGLWCCGRKPHARATGPATANATGAGAGAGERKGKAEGKKKAAGGATATATATGGGAAGGARAGDKAGNKAGAGAATGVQPGAAGQGQGQLRKRVKG